MATVSRSCRRNWRNRRSRRLLAVPASSAQRADHIDPTEKSLVKNGNANLLLFLSGVNERAMCMSTLPYACRQSLRPIELITCVMSSYLWSQPIAGPNTRAMQLWSCCCCSCSCSSGCCCCCCCCCCFCCCCRRRRCHRCHCYCRCRCRTNNNSHRIIVVRETDLNKNVCQFSSVNVCAVSSKNVPLP